MTDLGDGRNPLGWPKFHVQLDTVLKGNEFPGHSVPKFTCATPFQEKKEFIDAVYRTREMYKLQ